MASLNENFVNADKEVNVVFIDRNGNEVNGTMLLSAAGPAGAVVWNNTLYIYRYSILDSSQEDTFYFYELSVITTVGGTSINPRAIVIDWNQAK